MKKFKLGYVVIASVMAFVVFFGGMKIVSAISEKEIKAYYGIEYTPDYNKGTATVTAKNGSFNVTVVTTRSNGDTTDNYTLTAGSPLQIPISTRQEAIVKITVAATVKYQGSDYSEEFTIDIPGEVLVDEIANTHYDGVCADFRNSDDYKNAGANGQAFYQQSLSYCFSPTVSSNYSKSTIESMINTYKKLWKIKNSSLMNDDTTVSPESVLISPNVGDTTPRKVDKLQCDAFADSNERKYYTTQTTSVTHNGKEVCSVDCVEELTVTYSPPSSVKAGLCFEYSVTVRSKVACKSKVTIVPPVKKPVCTPVPICNDYANFQNQGGPNDDFDSCVNECDGGKYSQSCINKCYKKVYGVSTKIASEMENMITYNDAVAAKTASCGILNDVNTYDSNAIMNAIRSKTDGGKYYRSGNVIKWQPGSCVWERLGRFYFSNSNIASRTVNETTPTGGRERKDSRGRVYIMDTDGFKRSKTCKETCVWTGCTNGEYLNEKDAMDAYQKELADYETSNEAGTINFGPSTNTPNGDPNNKNDKDGIIQEQGGECYGKTEGGDDHYRTTINFPGTWINNKNGDVIYTNPPKNDEVFWHLEPHQFCTSADSKNVNVNWGIWKESGKKPTSGCSVVDKYSKCSTEEKEIVKDIDYNIHANINNFGRYKWSIAIDCFYSIFNEGVEENIPPTNTLCTDEECNTDISNYNFRVVNLEDLFPSSGAGATGSDQPSRETGFNWSADATNVNNEKFEITPTALIASIQTVGNNIYNEANEDQYLDYEIILDKATLRSIKNSFKNSNYAEFGESFGGSKSEIVSTNGVTSYRSALITSLSTSGKVRRRGLIGCNNQKNSSTCDKFTDEVVEAKRKLAQANK